MNKLYSKIIASIKQGLNESLLDDIYDDDPSGLETGDITENLTEYNLVDLDLPSGTLWCDRNLGATDINDNGLLYQWGDTEGVIPGQRLCNKDTYKFRTDKNIFTKYKKKGISIPLDLEDDAAYASSAGELCIPTRAQFQELIRCCKWKWETNNGTSGYRIKSKRSSSSIFLPAADKVSGYSSSNTNGSKYGFYWTNELYDKDTYRIPSSCFAYILYFSDDTKYSSEKPHIKSSYRADGIHIRAVSNK